VLKSSARAAAAATAAAVHFPCTSNLVVTTFNQWLCRCRRMMTHGTR
jgi:hypothetical protein